MPIKYTKANDVEFLSSFVPEAEIAAARAIDERPWHTVLSEMSDEDLCHRLSLIDFWDTDTGKACATVQTRCNQIHNAQARSTAYTMYSEACHGSVLRATSGFMVFPFIYYPFSQEKYDGILASLLESDRDVRRYEKTEFNRSDVIFDFKRMLEFYEWFVDPNTAIMKAAITILGEKNIKVFRHNGIPTGIRIDLPKGKPIYQIPRLIAIWSRYFSETFADNIYLARGKSYQNARDKGASIPVSLYWGEFEDNLYSNHGVFNTDTRTDSFDRFITNNYVVSSAEIMSGWYTSNKSSPECTLTNLMKLERELLA